MSQVLSVGMVRCVYQSMDPGHAMEQQKVYPSSMESKMIASSRLSPQTAGSALKRSQTGGRSGWL
jgi:hypothetical protein